MCQTKGVFLTKTFRILVINPGSTSTKVALFENIKELFMSSIMHSEKELQPFSKIADQHEFRVNVIEKSLGENSMDIQTLDCVVGRGGLLHPIPSGTYEVNEKMLQDLGKAEWGEHASNLGGIIAYDIGQEVGIPAFIVDPVVVDEMRPEARISGIPDIERRSIFHALNQKAVARIAAQELGLKYEEANLIVVHMGGGISVGAHEKGKVIDVNNALNGDGPFSPERAGGVPVGQLVELCFSGKYTEDELKKRLVGKGGVVAYLGTNDMRRVEKEFLSGDEKIKLIYSAMAYQVAKEIGVCATVLKGKVHRIVLTGGLAYDNHFVGLIRERVEWIAGISVYPGEEEMKSLAMGALRVLRGEEKAKIYS